MASRYDETEDKRHERLQRDWAKKDQLELDAAVAGLLEHPHGRRYLWWLLQTSKALGVNPFTGNALSTSFNCGEQNVGQQIMDHLISVSPEGFLTMMKERHDEIRERDAQLAMDD